MFVSVGTDHHRFDRLMAWIERWLADGAPARCLVQYGASRLPEHAEGAAYLDHDALARTMRDADVVVCHGGPSTIAEARRAGHLPIVVPRVRAEGEHVDDHQLHFTDRLTGEGLVHRCETEESFRAALDGALADPETFLITAPTEDGSVATSVHRAGRLIDTLLAVRGRHEPPAIPAPLAEPARWPSVSVVVPTRDRPELLRRTLDSVLEQDYPGDIRCVVVFDRCDPDKGIAVDDPHRSVSVVANDRTPGLAGTRNAGILAADGELVAFCDDDDTWRPDKLRAQVTALAAEPDAALCCCGITVWYDRRSIDRTLPVRRVGLADLLRSRLAELHPSTFLLRRSALVGEMGLVAEDIPGSYAEDYELLLRAARHGPIVNVPEPYVRVLWHRRSHFARRWGTIASALSWLLDRYPEFRLDSKGLARVAGQVAFAEAAAGRRGDALRWAIRTLRASPREPRAYLALAVGSGLVRADRVLRALNARGHGL
ncbi:MAG: glycosyltransferase [Streptosporangiaceae bacterium]